VEAFFLSIRAVIFDMGGVLLRDMDKAPRRRLAARLGVDEAHLAHLVFDSESARLATVGAISVTEHWEQVRQALGIPSQEIGEFVRDYFAGDAVDMQLVEAIRTLRGHMRTGLLSNAFDDTRQVVTGRWQIADAFDEMIFSAEVGLAKPDPRIYRLALARLGVAAGEALFVDDVPGNVQAAREVGMQAMQFVNTDETLKILKTFRVWDDGVGE
jgi:epoxide hydrolase-like predicted phosphatase